MLDKINYSKEQKYISQSEAQELKDRVKKLANNKGDLKEEEKRKINKQLDDALNKKGKEDKKDGGLKPIRIEDDKNLERQDKPGKEGSGGNKWKEFKSGYNSLKNASDKQFIKQIFGGVPQDDRLASWETLSSDKKNALVNSIKDGKLTDGERKTLRNLFKTTGGGGSGDGSGGGNTGGGGGGSGGGSGDGSGGGNTGGGGGGSGGGSGDGGGDGGGGGGDGDIPEDDNTEGGDEPEGDTKPIVKGSTKKIKLPGGDPITKYTINKKSKERLTMPNLDEKIFKEVQRITKNLISVTKEFIEGGINYDGIDFIPDDEILTEDGKSLFTFNDYNSPGTINSGMADERMADISRAIQSVLNTGVRGAKEYNYAEYIDLFELRYNNDGIPFYRFSLELVGEAIDDIVITFIKDGGYEDE
jgi:hypothetical protein